MKKSILSLGLAFTTLCCCNSCDNDLVEFRTNDLRITIEEGTEWLHDFPLFMGIKKKNPPQIAIWAEDSIGNYLSTLYVSHKIATQGWSVAGGNRRKESLPHWCYKRGVQYEDGLYLPTKKQPLTDALSGATPTGSFDVKIQPLENLSQFVIKAEFNHSTDFNDYYSKTATEGEDNYSGGKMGSGQPAVVYEVYIDLTSGQKEFTGRLAGHSSPDGTNGELSTDTSRLTTALHIVKQIKITLQ